MGEERPAALVRLDALKGGGEAVNFILAAGLVGLTLAAEVSTALSPVAEGLHAPYDALLRAHVKDGAVDYGALKGREKDLDAYLGALAKADPARLGREDRLALWINGYNAFTLKLVLENYPGVKSIKEIPRRWSRKRWSVGGTMFSIGEIEHEILRREFDEPRIHFAIVCASKSCPNLLSEAYAGSRIEEQLAGAARGFLKDAQRGFRARSEPGLLYGTNHNVYLSSVFKWFAADFEKGGKTVIESIAPYLPAEGRRFIEEHRGAISIRYLDYDWSLNGR